MDLEKYIKKTEYNPDINKTEIWVGNFSATPEYDPIDIISKVIFNFKKQNNKIIIDDFLQYNNITNWEKPLIFNDITFNKSVEFKFICFEDYVSFINCIFKEDVIFGKSSLKKDINFSNCTFKKNTNFWGTTFFSTSVFSESKFEGIDNNFWQSHFNENVFCENIKVKLSINFSEAIFEQNAYFKGAILGEEANFSEAKFKISQKSSTNKEISTNKKQKEEIDFSRVKFGMVAFSNAIFEKNVRFHEAVFNNDVYFYNTSFKEFVDFYLAKFHKAQQFYLTEFLDRAIFSNTVFHEEAQFLYNRVENNSYINFESTKFKRGLDISRSNFNCNLNFWNITIEINEISNNSKYIDDFGLYTEGTASLMYKRIRETCRIIKSYFYSQNNRIEGLNFYEKEMSVYLEEKRAEDKNSKQSKEKKLLTADSINISSKNIFNNIKKKYVNVYDSLDFLFVIGLSFLIVCFCVIYPFFYILKKIFQLIDFQEKKVFQKFFKYIREKFTNLGKAAYFLGKIFIRICFNRLITLKDKNFLLFTITFLVIIFTLGVVYIVQHKYIWYWFLVFLLILLLYIISYQNRKIIRSNIKSNYYISLVLLSIPIMIILTILYGMNNYKNDWVYKLLNYLSIQFSLIIKDEQIFSFILIIILIIIAIAFGTISKKQDKLLLWFNRNSNLFGTDWVVGINFTILVTLITYIIILCLNPNLSFSPNSEGVGNFLKGLVEIINITEWNNITLFGKNLTNWQYISLFIGRIFIAYGIYQTVQAFRKYGKS